jgi:CIC family chloride channel protein
MCDMPGTGDLPPHSPGPDPSDIDGSFERDPDILRARRIFRRGLSLIMPHAITRRAYRLLSLLPGFDSAGPLDLGLLGRMLLHAALVGAVAGIAGAMFYGALELVQSVLLEDVAGYVPIRAHGEPMHIVSGGHFRPWLLAILPALGGLLCGLVTRLAPEARGGGADAMIEAFHHHNALIRKRVTWVKGLASIATLGTGGAGGREGPTMQIGGAIGSLVSRLLNVSARERRILTLAGVAAGMSAVFRTPLGAALLAVEVLYRDGFESEALIPAVLASVVSYSVAISINGETTMFAHAEHYPFVPAHLPLYGLLAIAVAALAAGFVAALKTVRGYIARLKVPDWTRPAIGGLALGAFCVPLIMIVGERIGAPGQGLGMLGGGYGAVQMAITGSAWLPSGWGAVELLLLLTAAKLMAVSLTIGSGGSAGDFAPSLVLGGLFGGAFGRAAAMIFADPRIDPGAFALVGMGAFYGGIAHVPLSSLVLVCELAGSYDLLVPLMLAEAVAFVALRKRALYDAQLPTIRSSPVHRRDVMADVLKALRVSEVMARAHAFVSFAPNTPVAELLDRAAAADGQEIFPVLEGSTLKGIITTDTLHVIAAEHDLKQWALAQDVMQRAAMVAPDDDLAVAMRAMLTHELRAIPVVDPKEGIVGFLDEADIVKVYIAGRGPDL